MTTKLLAILVFAFALLIPTLARAHGGHTHKVMGTVSAVQGNDVEVKGTDGKVVKIVLNAKTTVTRGATKLDATALRPGERVSVDYMQEKTINRATNSQMDRFRMDSSPRQRECEG